MFIEDCLQSYVNRFFLMEVENEKSIGPNIGASTFKLVKQNFAVWQIVPEAAPQSKIMK